MKVESILRLQRDLSIEFCKSIGLKDVLQCLIHHILRIEYVDAGGIYMRNQNSGALDLVMHEGLPDAFVTVVAHYNSDSPQAGFIIGGKPVYIHFSKLQLPFDMPDKDKQLKAIAIIPLIHDNNVIGALNIASLTQDEFSENTRDIIEIISGMTGGAIVRSQTHDALVKSEKRIRTIIDTAPMAITSTDLNGIIISCNQATLDLHGYSHESELIGKKALDFIAPEDKKKAEENILVTIDKGATKGIEYNVIGKENKIIPIKLSASVIKNENNEITGFLAMAQDISHSKQMESQLRQSEKMQAIGQLAGGVAHDFNNQLSGIVGYADLLSEELSNNPELSNYANNILLASKRAADLTTQLLAFARKGQYLYETIDLNQIIDEVVNILKRTINKNIKISKIYETQTSTIMGDPSQIQNAFLNIALNARDAMPNGGELIISSSPVQLDEEYCSKCSYEIVPGNYIVMCATDNGEGMTKKIQKKMFEPFFTTKEQGKGSGMGLASVYGTIKNHGGAINVYSEPGHGTSMKIYLPQSRVETNTTTQKPAHYNTATKEAHVLIVDDEDLILEVATSMLEKCGYKVSKCSNSKDAIKIYRENWKSINIVLLDMVMPIMNGREIFIEMKKTNPQIRSILSSGYTINEEVQQILNLGVMGFIQKPYKKAALSQKVSEILNTEIVV